MAFVPCAPLQLRARLWVSCEHAVRLRTANRCHVTPVALAAPTGKKSRRFVPGKGAGAQKTKLEPEEVFMEVRPNWTELIVPTVSILTVIGIIPFIGSVARQVWVRYKLTNRRISITSGFQGKDLTEIIYRDISKVRFVRRLGGTGDMVLWLKDEAKIELRTVPELDKIFEFIMTKVDDDVRNASGSA